MQAARRLALEIRASFGVEGILSDRQLDAILAHYGVTVREYRFHSRLREVICDGVIYLQRGMCRASKRWDKSHSLYHHICNVGNQAEQPEIVQCKWEQAADVFAGYLIFGELRVSCCCGNPYPFHMVADWGEVPEQKVRKWWALVQSAFASAVVLGAKLIVPIAISFALTYSSSAAFW